MRIHMHFPGQGAQYKEMGMDLYASSACFRKVVDRGAEITGYDFLSILKNEEMLSETRYAQPIIYAMSLGIANILQEEGVKADTASGLSLGEYAALTLGEAVTMDDGFALLKERARLMQEAAEARPGFLAAVSFLSRESLGEAIHGLKGLYISNMNAWAHNVAGGEAGMKALFEERVKEKGAKKITYLAVSGAFHTELMHGAGEKYGESLLQREFSHPEIHVTSNFKGDYYAEGDNIRDILKYHISSPVRLDACLCSLKSEDEDINIIIGPGRALGSILKQNHVKGETIYAGTLEEIKDAVRLIREKSNGK